MRVAGVDGAEGGWVMAVTGVGEGSPLEFSLWHSFGDLWSHAHEIGIAALGVDMPIGLPTSDSRTADRRARELLGPRRSSLFWTPPTASLNADDYADANRITKAQTGKGLSKQAFCLLPKIREVRAVLKPEDFTNDALPRAAEVHPELCLAQMAGAPMEHSKHRQAGIAERLNLLGSHFDGIVETAALTPLTGPPHPSLDDLLDAAAAAWSARRLAAGDAVFLGAIEESVPVDAANYPLTIVV